MKSRLEVYALAVCYSALVCLGISAWLGGYAVLKIVKPDLTLSEYQYRGYRNNDEFWDSIKTFGTPEDRKLEQRPAEEYLTKRRLESFNRALAHERRHGVQDFTGYAILFSICAISFFVHWRIAHRARSELRAYPNTPRP